MTDAANPVKIRTLIYDRDAETDSQSLLDIREFDAPPVMERQLSYTDMSKDALRRAMLVDLARQIDGLLSGDIDEIRIVATR